MPANIPEDKLNLLYKNFRLIDADNDKHISEQEFKVLMRLIGQTKTEKELNQIIEEYFEDENDIKENEQEQGKGKEEGKEKEKEKEKGGKATLPEKSTPPEKALSKRAELPIKNSKIGITKGLSKLSIKNCLQKGNVAIDANDDQKEIKKKKKINFETFVKILQETYTEPISINELIKSFEIFDNEKKGYIQLQQLKTILTNCEERLNDEDINFFLKSIPLKDNNMIDYVDMSNQLKSGQC